MNVVSLQYMLLLNSNEKRSEAGDIKAFQERLL